MTAPGRPNIGQVGGRQICKLGTPSSLTGRAVPQLMAQRKYMGGNQQFKFQPRNELNKSKSYQQQQPISLKGNPTSQNQSIVIGQQLPISSGNNKKLKNGSGIFSQSTLFSKTLNLPLTSRRNYPSISMQAQPSHPNLTKLGQKSAPGGIPNQNQINQPVVPTQMTSIYNNKKQFNRTKVQANAINHSKTQFNAISADGQAKIKIHELEQIGDVIEEFQDEQFADEFYKLNQEDSQTDAEAIPAAQLAQEQQKESIPEFKKKLTANKLFKRPEKMLIYCKAFDDNIIPNFIELYKYLTSEYPETEIFAEKWLIERTADEEIDATPTLFENENDEERDNIDFIVVMGGDGTVLWASKQFRYGKIPPILSFSMGSYGYLCTYQFENHRQVIDQVMNLDDSINLDERLRLKLSVPINPVREIYRGNDLMPSCSTNVEGYHILNELVIDRGPSPFAIQIEIHFDGQYMTTMVGDGLIVATPSGSTAYNLSAGGSIVQSNTDCICVTPLAPHSLSFRPVVLPSSTTITLRKPKDNRNSAWVSLDGATRFELRDGEELHLEAADTKMSMIVDSSELMKQWGQRLVQLLNWNQRQPQKAFTRKITGDASEDQNINQQDS